jgi:hypothetical protein
LTTKNTRRDSIFFRVIRVFRGQNTSDSSHPVNDYLVEHYAGAYAGRGILADTAKTNHLRKALIAPDQSRAA